MVNISSWFLALRSHCVSFDPKAVAKALRWFCQRHTKAFQIYSTSKDLFLLLLGSTIPSKEVVFIGRGFAGRNVWLSVCVLVAWTCRPVSAITTGNDQQFALKSQQSFSLFLLSPETRGDRPLPLTLPMLSTHPPLLPTQSLAIKCLLECRTSVY